MKYFFDNIKKNFLQFLQVQFFLSLVSLPVIVAWGLPFSLMTAFGNFIFSPFIVAFLLCSSLIFFTELFSIPNDYLIFLLTHITRLWLYFLSFGSKFWLIGFSIKLLPFLLIIAMCAFFALQYQKLQKPLYYIGVSIFLISIIAISMSKSEKTLYIEVICNKKKLSIINNNGRLHLIDQGALGEKNNPNSWIVYTLIPEIVKNFGSIVIDELIYFDESRSTEKAINALSQEIVVKKITKGN